MGPILRVKLLSELQEVRRLNDTAARFLQEQGASAATIHDVQLVLEEVTTNVIRHATPAHSPLTLEIEMEMEPAAVRVRIEDDGAEFDPTVASDKTAGDSHQDRRPGGYGLRIVRRTAVRLDYRRFNGLNVLEMWVPRLA
ncbi:MAG: ATP-binding protein [Acidobacteria bacterium]|nr:ATP-binding protein [Acidobacteriota bacterium]